jgi:hypothetical protein
MLSAHPLASSSHTTASHREGLHLAPRWALKGRQTGHWLCQSEMESREQGIFGLKDELGEAPVSSPSLAQKLCRALDPCHPKLPYHLASWQNLHPSTTLSAEDHLLKLKSWPSVMGKTQSSTGAWGLAQALMWQRRLSEGPMLWGK